MSRDRSRSRSPRSSDRDRDRGRRSHSSADREVLESCWKPVREDPQNFDAWTQLLQAVENVDDTKSAREAFDSFLEKFPYCFGYWRKYAEFERRHKHYERAIEVYERGVTAIPLSVDLWISYLTFYKEHVKDSDVKDKRIRYNYERALTSAGLEFRSDKLWEDYINWEIKNENYENAVNVYDRLLKTPTMLYGNHWERFQEFVNTHEPHEILTRSEFDRFYAEVEEQLKEKGEEVFTVEEVQENKSDVDESSDEDEDDEKDGANARIKMEPDEVKDDNGSGIGGNNYGDADESGSRDKRKKDPRKNKPRKRQARHKHRSSKGEYRKKYNEEAMKLFRMKILDKRRKIHLKTEQEVSKRWTFEEQIKRPYFHVKPLERSQLKNWRQYLEWEMNEGSQDRVRVLFERCLIACALYEDMWIRYARYLEKTDPVETRHIYERACRTHLPRKPNPHLAWVMFEEKLGNYEEAKSILSRFDKTCPGLAVIQLRRLGIDRRFAVHTARKRDDATPDYSDLCRRYEMLIHDDTVAPRVASSFAIKFARFQSKIRRDNRLAEKVILDALDRDKNNEGLYLQMVDLAYSADPFSLPDVIKSMDYALESKHLTDTQKLEFSRRKLELLEEFGDDISEIQDHYEFHMKLSKSLGFSGSSGRKRAGDAAEGDSSKKSRGEGTSNAATPTPAATGGGQQQGSTPSAAVHITPSAIHANVPPTAGGYYYYGAAPGPGAGMPPAYGVPPNAAAYPYPTAAPTQGGYYYPPSTY